MSNSSSVSLRLRWIMRAFPVHTPSGARRCRRFDPRISQARAGVSLGEGGPAQGPVGKHLGRETARSVGIRRRTSGFDPLLPVGIPKTRRSNCKKRTSAEPQSQAALCAAASHGTGRPTLRQRDRGPEVGTRSGSSAIDRSAHSARTLASFASYADPLLSHTEIVSWGPERQSDFGNAETS